MPKTIRRTITTTLTREAVRLARPAVGAWLWCPVCGQETRFVEPETAASLTGATRRQVYRAVEAGAVHFIEPAEGPAEGLWLCTGSLGALGPVTVQG